MTDTHPGFFGRTGGAGSAVVTARGGCCGAVRVDGVRLVAATDPFASAPIHHALVPGGVVVASTLGRLLAEPGVSHEVDGAHVAQSLAGWPNATSTPFRAIRRLAPRMQLVAQGGCVRVEPTPADVLPPVGLAAALDAAVRRCSFPGGAACALSGGLDSAVLLALLRDVLGSRPSAFTIARVGSADGELGRARAVAAHLGANLFEVEVLVDELPRHLEQTVRAAEAVVYNGLAVVKHLFHRRVAESGARTLLSGVGADEVLLGDPERYAFADGAPAFVRRFEPELQLGRSLLRPGVEPSPFPVPSLAPREPLRRAQALELRTVLPLSTLPIERGTAAAGGLDVRLPFLDPAVVAHAAFLPVSALVRGSTGKAPLRELFAHVLPSAFAALPKTPRLVRPSTETAAQRLAWLDAYRALVTPARVEALQVVDPSRAEALLDRLARTSVRDPSFGLLDRVVMKLASLTVLVDDGA